MAVSLCRFLLRTYPTVVYTRCISFSEFLTMPPKKRLATQENAVENGASGDGPRQKLPRAAKQAAVETLKAKEEPPKKAKKRPTKEKKTAKGDAVDEGPEDDQAGPSDKEKNGEAARSKPKKGKAAGKSAKREPKVKDKKVDGEENDKDTEGKKEDAIDEVAEEEEAVVKSKRGKKKVKGS